MNKKYVIDNVEKILNNEIIDFDFAEAEIEDTVVDIFMKNSAIRLINSHKRLRCGECGLSDYLVSIRNFMLVFKTPLKINEIEITGGNNFGIYKDVSGCRYYASYDIPEYIKYDAFVKEAFVNTGTQESKIKSKYSLKTNGYLRKLTGFDTFKSIEQKLSVYGALNTPTGYTALVSMPTGGGKSLVTQTVGFESNGLSIVIVPTVSLAIDQERAARINIKVAKENEVFCYYSGIDNFAQISEAIETQTAKLLFISPEALIKNEQFKLLVQKANSTRYLKNLIIDEAHIAVAWGDFFRVDYQCLGPWRSNLLKTNPDIRTFLLSATFRDDTVSILKRMFANCEKWIEIRCDSLRKEPRFILVQSKSHIDKRNKVFELVSKLPRPLILYVNAPYEAKKWKAFLEKNGYGNIKMFTGETKADERKSLIDEWADNKFDLMIATSAFGVGVDKADVRSVIHLYVPESPDTYYQELGRGGRDGLPCLSVMCIEEDDISSAFNHVSKVLTTEKLWGRWWSMFRNPANQWQNGLIAIFASTKPNYNKISYFEEGNDTDEKWNINVLLLLSRYQQIKIIALDLDKENRYIFTVKILNDQITQETDETKQLFDDIRERESNKAQKSFGLIKNAIEKRGKLCWSEMFYDTYPLVSEYCPGCDYHDNIIADELHRFPLLVDVTAPEKPISDAMKEFYSDTNEALIISKSDIAEIISNYMPDVVVCENVEHIEDIYSPVINYMNFAEFRALQMHDSSFYTSGLVMSIYSDNPEKAISEYQTMIKYLNKFRYVIHVSKSDFFISKLNVKTISDQIDGTVIR